MDTQNLTVVLNTAAQTNPWLSVENATPKMLLALVKAAGLKILVKGIADDQILIDGLTKAILSLILHEVQIESPAHLFGLYESLELELSAVDGEISVHIAKGSIAKLGIRARDIFGYVLTGNMDTGLRFNEDTYIDLVKHHLSNSVVKNTILKGIRAWRHGDSDALTTSMVEYWIKQNVETRGFLVDWDGHPELYLAQIVESYNKK